VVFFVKDVSGKVHSKSTNLNPLDIDFIPSFSIMENRLQCSIHTSQQSLEFAFYLYLNDEKVRKIWYSKNTSAEFQIGETKLHKFEIKYFIRDMDSNINLRSIKYDKIEPEKNISKTNNQFSFFLSENKKIIYKKVNSDTPRLPKILENPEKKERFSNILNGKQFISQMKSHIVKGFELEPTGSYKSKYIIGYRLDLLCLLMSKYPSLNLPSRLELNKIIQQCGILVKALQNAESKGELCGDWALHNLIYSIDKNKIYNVDLEGFMTYDPLPKWANLEKIVSWINKLKHIYSNI